MIVQTLSEHIQPWPLDLTCGRYIPERKRLLDNAVEAVRLAQVRHSLAEDAYAAGRITQEQWYKACEDLTYYQNAEAAARDAAAAEMHTW